MIAIVILICWLAGFAVLWRVPVCDGHTVGDQHSADEKAICIIIPARNEAANLPRLLKSIAEQDWKPAEVIVVDDDSTDGTAEIARAGGAKVISAGRLPEDWRGKPWACQRGAEATSAPHILFLDADTWFEPGGLGRIAETYFGEQGVLSVVPYHVVPTLRERISAFFNLVMTAGIGAFTVFNRDPDGLFGQMLLIDRHTYRQVGGHERVKEYVLENLHLAGQLRAQNVKLRCASGKGSLSIRMYPGGWVEMIRGWSKGFASGAGATSALVMGLTIAWLSGAIMAAIFLAQARNPLSATTYTLYVVQLYFMLRKSGSFGLITAMLYPISLLFFFWVFGGSIARSGRSVTWKGRAIRAG
jgi:4,4'-diaponeurosporenoate glycosyltransferase